VNEGVIARSTWSLDGTVGKLTNGPLSGEVNVAYPHLGLRCKELDYKKRKCALLRVVRSDKSLVVTAKMTDGDARAWPLPVVDEYLRGYDLVASYQAVEDWPYAPQIYWQTNALDFVDGVAASMSVLVSVQTHLLDTWPRISVVSQVASEELLHISLGENQQAEVERIDDEKTSIAAGAGSCVIWRLRAVPMSYAEIMPATDFRQIAFRPNVEANSSAEWHVMADFLEKGVIRRARVHAAILPRENDVELALECCRAIENCPLPLTT
jgi:hypothetical protein